MKALVFAVIAGIAAVMGWLWFQPECPDGAVALTESECVNVRGFDRAFCARAFARPEEALFAAGFSYRSQSDCLERHKDCIEMPKPVYWSPKPSGYCVVRGPSGEVARMTPVFGPRK